jgi:transposase
MPTDEPTQLADWREERRLCAWELKQAGWRQKDIAETLGVTKGAVSQWIKRVREKGVSDLRRKAASGAPRRLRDDQIAHLLNLFSKGAEQYGFCGETWTYKRVADLIQREFNVSYSERHVGRLLKRGCAGNLERRIE